MKNIKVCLIVLGIMTPAFAVASNVESVSKAKNLRTSEGSLSQVEVECTNGSKMILQKLRKSGSKWCARDLEDVCKTVQSYAAEEVCQDKYAVNVEIATPEPAQASPADTASGITGMELDDDVMGAKSGNPEVEEDVRSNTATPALTITSEPAVKASSALSAEEAATVAAKKEAIELEERQLQIEKERLEIQKEELEVQRQAYKLRQLIEEEEARKAAQAAAEVKAIEVRKAAEAEKIAKQEEKKSSVPALFRTTEID